MSTDPSIQYEGIKRAELYVKHRPKIPHQVIARILSYLKEKYEGDLTLAVDAGCGSGQCTDSLAPHFKKVLASDISAGQIEIAKSMVHPPNIEFKRGPAEKIEVETGLAQLVNASQAAHYFDLPAFFKEADRALCKNGIVAVSGADFKSEFDHGPIISEKLSQLINNLWNEKIRPHSPDQVGIIERGYADIVPPVPPFSDLVREIIPLDDICVPLIAFVESVRSWCGFQNFCQVNGDEAGNKVLEEFQEKLYKALQTDQPVEKCQLKMKPKHRLIMGRKA